MAKDFVPKNAEHFNNFCTTLLTYVDKKIHNWGHIPLEEKHNVEQCYNNFKQIYTAQANNETVKRGVHTECKKQIRRFVNNYLRFNPVTNVDRIYMGVPNRSEA